MPRRTRISISALGVVLVLGCTMGPLQPSMGLYGLSGDLLIRPLYDADSFVLVNASDPVCPDHEEGAVRFVAEQGANGEVSLTLVRANPPDVAPCLDQLDVTLHLYDADPRVPPPGTSSEVIVAWPEDGNAWDLAEPLLPERTVGDGCRRRLDQMLLPDGRL